MTLCITSQGNRIAYYNGFHVFFQKRPHAGWAVFISYRGLPLHFQGYFTRCLPTLKMAKDHVIAWFTEDKLNSI